MGVSSKKNTPEQIIGKSREAGIPLVPRNTEGEINRKKGSRVQNGRSYPFLLVVAHV
jgi:hypothetical protein